MLTDPRSTPLPLLLTPRPRSNNSHYLDLFMTMVEKKNPKNMTNNSIAMIFLQIKTEE